MQDQVAVRTQDHALLNFRQYLFLFSAAHNHPANIDLFRRRVTMVELNCRRMIEPALFTGQGGFELSEPAFVILQMPADVFSLFVRVGVGHSVFPVTKGAPPFPMANGAKGRRGVGRPFRTHASFEPAMHAKLACFVTSVNPLFAIKSLVECRFSLLRAQIHPFSKK
jgi:hypothetical protein